VVIVKTKMVASGGHLIQVCTRDVEQSAEVIFLHTGS